MKVAIVTPVGPQCDEHLQQCHDSVAQQSYACEHVIVGDGQPLSVSGQFHRLELPRAANDIGSTPRAIGSIYAFGQGFDAVCWLDADNWLAPEHVQLLVEHHQETGKPVVASGRKITDMSGSLMATCVEMHPGSKFFDTSTMMVTWPVRAIAINWAMLRPEQHFAGDRHISQLARQAGMSCHYQPTLYYRSNWKFHYETYGWPSDGLQLKSVDHRSTEPHL